MKTKPKLRKKKTTKSIVIEIICRRARPREREVQIHLRRLGSHFHRIGWLNIAESSIYFTHPKQQEKNNKIGLRNAVNDRRSQKKKKKRQTNIISTDQRPYNYFIITTIICNIVIKT